jgi:hypothetical protein
MTAAELEVENERIREAEAQLQAKKWTLGEVQHYKREHTPTAFEKFRPYIEESHARGDFRYEHEMGEKEFREWRQVPDNVLVLHESDIGLLSEASGRSKYETIHNPEARFWGDIMSKRAVIQLGERQPDGKAIIGRVYSGFPGETDTQQAVRLNKLITASIPAI